jgi:myosin-5
MHFLICANNTLQSGTNQSGSSDALGAHIKHVLEESNVILEAFGNAKTIRNDNSSRFGKYIKLKYSSNNELSAASTDVFLLERSRLVSLNLGERNYHVLYQMLRDSMTESTSDCTLNRSALGLRDVSDFSILTMGSCTVLNSEVEDSVLFSRLCHALRKIGLTDTEMTSLWELLAVLLHLGNVKVLDPLSVEGESALVLPESSATDDSSAANKGTTRRLEEERAQILLESIDLEKLCSLLGVSCEQFLEKLTVRMVKVDGRMSIQLVALSVAEVKNNVSSLMKYLYNDIFNWLVKKINAAHLNLKGSSANPSTPGKESKLSRELVSFESERGSFVDADYKFIGILDIFGFEILNTNSFEQLCINYANERLQQQFNETIFVHEQIEYEKKGISVPDIVYLNNQDVLDLFAKKPYGIFNVLEEFSLLNRHTDSVTIVSYFNQHHEGTNKAFVKKKFGSKIDQDKFIVRHFAGEVNYTAAELLAKNNSSLQEDLKLLVSFSTNAFLQEIISASNIKIENDVTATPAKNVSRQLSNASNHGSSIKRSSSTVASTPSGGRKIAATFTVSYHFREQLEDLMKTLRSTEPHYVKCIKPNGNKEASNFQSQQTLDQLRYSGVLDVVRIRRQGFPVHSHFRGFHSALKLLLFFSPVYHRDPYKCSIEESKESCLLVASQVLPEVLYAVGLTKVFLKESAPDSLTVALISMRNKITTIIQTSWRFHHAHWLFTRLRKATVTIQEYFLTRLTRMRYLTLRNGMNRLKAQCRRNKQICNYRHIVRQIVILQTLQRKALAKAHLERLRMNKASSKISLWIIKTLNRYRLRFQFIKFRKAVVVLQGHQRRKKSIKSARLRREWLQIKSKKEVADLEKKRIIAAHKVQIFWRSYKKGLILKGSIKDVVVLSIVRNYISILKKRTLRNRK